MNNAHFEKQTKEIDPLFRHLEGFRHTFAHIRRQQYMAKSAVRTSVDSELIYEIDDGPTQEIRHELAKLAQEYSSHLDPHDPNKIYSGIIGALPDYVDAIHTLPDRHDTEHYHPWISEETRDAAIKKTIAFNDVLRGIIDNNSNLPLDIVMKLVAAAANRYRYSDEERERIKENTRGILIGMQHELAFESALIYLPEGFDIINTTDDDDAHGADFKVRCPNGKIVSIDVKATERLEYEARLRTKKHFKKIGKTPPQNEIILYSGFIESDFEGSTSWRPSDEAIRRVLPDILKALLKASGDNPARFQQQAIQY